MILRSCCKRWWVLFLKGLCAIALGISAIAWPGITLVSLIFVFATFTLIDGVAAIVLGFKGESDGTVWWTLVLMGVLAILAGLISFFYPQITVTVLLAIIAVSAIVRGAFELMAAIRLRKELDDEWILALSGLMSILFGGLILYRPDAGLLAIVLLIGAYMIAIGVFALALSLRLRRVAHTLAPAT
ncbi:MAG: HdeD family acid-resistance protein [Pirellulales bacterium]